MSRYRKIHCLIWNDDKFPFLSDKAQLVFFHLLTTPLSNQLGCFKAGLASLSEEKRCSVEGYREGFQELIKEGFIKYDERHLVVYINNFIKYNPPESPNVVKSWAITFNELPKSQLKLLCYQSLKAVLQGYGEGFHKAFTEAFGKGLLKGIPNQEQEQEQEQEQDNILSAPSPEPDDPPKKSKSRFDEFWAEYPKKINPKKSLEIWKRKRLDERADELIEDVRHRKKNHKRWLEGFIPDPTTYLNQERWQDEIEISNGGDYEQRNRNISQTRGGLTDRQKVNAALSDLNDTSWARARGPGEGNIYDGSIEID